MISVKKNFNSAFNFSNDLIKSIPPNAHWEAVLDMGLLFLKSVESFDSAL